MLQLVLDQYSAGAYDYGRAINFKIYSEDNTQFNATGYTAKVILLNADYVQAINTITPTWTAQNTGQGYFKFTSTDRPMRAGIYLVELQLEKTGEQISTAPQSFNIVATGPG